MLRPKLPLFVGLLVLAAAALSAFPHACTARGMHKHCASSSCGNVTIKYPFRLKTQPPRCGYKKLELECDSNKNLSLWPMKYGNFYVQNISYIDQTFRILDANLVDDKDNCSIPRSSLPYTNSWYYNIGNRMALYPPAESSIMYLVNCTMKMNESSVYIDAFRGCSSSTHNRSSSEPPSNNYLYFLDENTAASDFHQSCRVAAQIPIMVSVIWGLSTSQIYSNLSMGYEFSWSTYILFRVPHRNSILGIFFLFVHELTMALVIYVKSNLAFLLQVTSLDVFFLTKALAKGIEVLCVGIPGIILIRTLLGISCLIVLVIRKLIRRHLSTDDKIEDFLESQNNFMPIRYSYRDVKRMTSGFKDKLGQGGYGSVFKGRLRSGQFVAIKLLNKSKANGEDFVAEVATIGRIHHVNVVRLIGFCVEGSRQALVYDFMTNGSLDKILFSTTNKSLSWQKMFEIALGVARGIEYLHRGCEMQILHFDIKPHNILLDENISPKISDFGLAKLYSVDESIISLTAARGTIGYMAPELFYKNIGGISYKADVYSFGMMLMEMVGRRKNLNALADHSSQIYFPTWIYDRFEKGESLDLEDATEDECKIARKMMIVAIWCIQMKPTNRPSMSKAIEMLENEVELPERPPKPFLFSLDELSTRDGKSSMDTTATTSFSANNIVM